MVSEVETNTGRDGDAATLHALLSASFAGMAERIDPPSSMTRMSVEDVRGKLTEEDLFLIRRGGDPVACLSMTDPAITDDLIAAHGLKPDEYARILQIIGREPSFTELGIFSAMWNEHCSYKSSKKWLRTLPTEGPQVICGPGENAGIVDIGDGWQETGVVFKMESHNHPSYIEPTQGAATGVGGILRDVFTMGARPIAAMNALSFGAKDHPKTRALVHGVVEGIGGYGNCFGVPTIGGETRFHPAYNGNCLVNAFAAGLVETDKHLLFRRLRCRHAGGLSRRQDGARRGWRGDHGLGRIRRHDRGKAPHRAGRRPLHRKASAGGLPGADGDGRRDLDPGHGGRGPDLFGGRDGRQGGPRHPADARPRAAARRRR
jgi:hypothetical protein